MCVSVYVCALVDVVDVKGRLLVEGIVCVCVCVCMCMCVLW